MLSVLMLASAGNSNADKQPNIETESFWIVLPPEVARHTAGYGIIKNTGEASDTLLKITSNAGAVMLHKTEIQSGKARMTHIPNIVIEAHSELVLKPMSFHLMFSDLSPVIFIDGSKATLFLEFEQSGIIKINILIRPNW